jgi:hypothetical protein
MRKLMNINLFISLMSSSDNKTSKETITMKDLSAAIESDLDNGKYLNDQGKTDHSDNKNEELLKKQYEELKKLKELKDKYNDDPKPQIPRSLTQNVSSDVQDKKEDNKDKKEESDSGILKYIKEPIILFVLFLIISHPFLSSLLSKYIPFFKTNDDGSTSIITLISKAVLFAITFFIIKIFI